MRGLWPRRRDGRPRSVDDRLLGDSRRRHRRRSHGAVRRDRRAHRNHAQVGEPRVVCAGRAACGALPSGPAERPLRHAGRARPALSVSRTHPGPLPMAHTGILHYLETSDAITHGVAYLLLAMSVASWCFLIVKSWMLGRAKRQAPRALALFWQATTLSDGVVVMRLADKERVFAPLAEAALHAAE